jgi:hypothetical protein
MKKLIVLIFALFFFGLDLIAQDSLNCCGMVVITPSTEHLAKEKIIKVSKHQMQADVLLLINQNSIKFQENNIRAYSFYVHLDSKGQVVNINHKRHVRKIQKINEIITLYLRKIAPYHMESYIDGKGIHQTHVNGLVIDFIFKPEENMVDISWY